MQELVREAKCSDKHIGFVPTMGFLHDGHASLIRRCREDNEICLVSVFVNPLQFNDPADYEKYPVDREHDVQVCQEAGADIVFFPSRQEILGDQQRPPRLVITMPDLTATLCGPGRPGHFEGVMLIVARLFHIVMPDRAYFGRKDYQQYRIIRRMVEDMAFPVDVIGLPSIREEDGLAMSSRNARLDEQTRKDATLIFRAMNLIEKSVEEGVRDPQKLEAIGRDVLESSPYATVEYVQLVHPESLTHFSTKHALEDAGRFVIGIAVHFKDVRLIDNREISFSHA